MHTYVCTVHITARLFYVLVSCFVVSVHSSIVLEQHFFSLAVSTTGRYCVQLSYKEMKVLSTNVYVLLNH